MATVPYQLDLTYDQTPISDGGWTNGATNGGWWADINVTSDQTRATDTNKDSVAVLTGSSWPADQGIVATVRTVSQTLTVVEEVELWLRATLSLQNLTGYEVFARCYASGSPDGYLKVYRADPGEGQGEELTLTFDNTWPGLNDGDTLRAEIVGNTIKIYLNEVLIAHVSDDTYAAGNPGTGLYLSGSDLALSANFGLTSFRVYEPATVTYFGECSSDGSLLKVPDGYDTGQSGGQLNYNNPATHLYTCPGSGQREIVSIAAYAKNLNAAKNIRCVIYDANQIEVCEWSGPISVSSATPAWYEKLAAEITPADQPTGDPAYLTGGQGYVLAVAVADSDPIPAYNNATENWSRYTAAADYTVVGFPGDISGLTNFQNNKNFVIRVGLVSQQVVVGPFPTFRPDLL